MTAIGPIAARTQPESHHGDHCLIDGRPICGWPEFHRTKGSSTPIADRARRGERVVR